MFTIDNDMTINVTRGDCGTFDVSATIDGAIYFFEPGDILRLKVFEKKNCENVVLKKDFGVEVITDTVTLSLTAQDTKIGEIINKPINYWYEIELNPETNPQTIVSYDDDGPKLFSLHPEGNETEEIYPEETEIGAFDYELDLTSNKALPNWVIAQEFFALQSKVKQIETGAMSVKAFGAVGDGVTDDREAIETAVSAIADNSVLSFPKGHYMIKSFPEEFVGTNYFNSAIFRIANKKNVVIDLNGSTIEICENGYVRYELFEFIDCENFVIKNGIIKGDRMSHDYTTVNSTHEWGCGVMVRSSKYSGRTDATNPEEFVEPTANKCYGQIANLEIYDFTGDGITINNGLSPGKVEVTDCNIHHCRRQGITIGDSDIVAVNRCHIHHIGTFDGVVGASPQSGIDIEPDMGTYHVSKVVLRDTVIENICGYTVVCAPRTIYESNGTLKGAKYIVDEMFIDSCTINGALYLGGWKKRTYNGEAVEYTPTLITNSELTHGLHYVLNSTKTDIELKYRALYFCGTKIFNSIINSCSEDIYTDNTDYTVFACPSTETVLIENCVINLLLENARLRNGQLTNVIVNGGSIYSFEQASNNATIKDCTNVTFNGCLFAITGAIKKFKFALCRFKNCGLVKDDTGTLALRNCYLDSRIFANASYVNCTIEDEIEV